MCDLERERDIMWGCECASMFNCEFVCASLSVFVGVSVCVSVCVREKERWECVFVCINTNVLITFFQQVLGKHFMTEQFNFGTDKAGN